MRYETALNHGAEALRWLLVAAIAYTVATTVWTFFDTPVTSNAVPAPTPAATASPQRAPANINAILSKHLFGEAGKAAPNTPTRDDTPAVATRLPLTLQSVFMSDEMSESAAIVAQQGKGAQRYTVGATLPGNAQLLEVQKDRIILLRAGTRESLMFPKPNANQRATVVAAVFEDADEAIEEDGRSYAEEQAYDDEDSAPPTKPARAGDPMASLESYRARLLDDAEGTLNELGIETVEENGGYRIGDIAQSSYLRQTGLQPGDIILSVNGQAVGDINRDQMELANIMAQGTARIEVQRGARRFYITASLSGMQ